MNEKVKQVLGIILEKFKSGEIPEAVALASFPVPDVPSGRWSFLNRTIMFLSGTGDARGFRQWTKVSRKVKKGAKAIHILVPCFKKKIDDDTGEEKQVLSFFKATPVFRYEDTEGEKLDYEQIELPELPLADRAKEWGISLKAIPGNYRYMGYFQPNKKEIGLASPEEVTFFHELSHCAHEKVKGKLQKGQNPFQEIIAELSAQALCRLVGKRDKDSIGNSYRYIEKYAKAVKMTPYKACLKVMSETEKVLDLILKKTKSNALIK